MRKDWADYLDTATELDRKVGAIFEDEGVEKIAETIDLQEEVQVGGIGGALGPKW